MKKFDRLPSEQRKEEIRTAALRLFNQKGFSATTMENIVEQVTLSKGGVYRLYASTTAILGDLMIEGMHMRNTYYEMRVRQEISGGKSLTLPFLIEMIGDSLLLYPEFSAVYVEFLWEKRRNPELETLYQEICKTTLLETTALIQKYGADDLLAGEVSLERVTEVMNAAVLSLHVLGLQKTFAVRREMLCNAITQILEI